MYIEAEAENNKGIPVATTSTGFYIDREGNILTVYHALSGLGDFRPDTLKIKIHGWRKDTKPSSAAVIDFSESRDLLLLKGSNLADSKPVCTSGSRNPSSLLNEKVYSEGFPTNLPFVTAVGDIVSAEGPGGTVITDMAINPGQSGSPVFLKDGTIVGIAKGQMFSGNNKPVAGQYVFIPFTDAKRITPEIVGRPGCPDEQLPEIDTNSIPTGTDKSIDIIAIIDDSASMVQEQKKFFEGFSHFLGGIGQDGDIRICMLTTDAKYYNGNSLIWIKKNGDSDEFVTAALDKNTPEFDTVLNDTFKSIGSEWSSDEQGIKSLNLHIRYKGNKGCLRQKGLLLAIMLTDEDERSTGGQYSLSTEQYKPLDPEDYPENLLDTVKRILPQKAFLWNSIIVVPGDRKCEAVQDAQDYPSFFGTLYEKLSEKTGGYVGSVCEPDYDVHFEGIASAAESKMTP
ncbi:trypsin-like peptidase domain-containing protein [Mesorhizobium sp. M1423]|uniref:S1 family peptidase n=1 Tax=Mesorhizobium sp. M1423 TaxID=2957101 RepID=UPI00333C784D